MNERVAVRNLEQIQEDDDPTRMPRAATLAFVGLGATCLVFAAMALGGRTTTAPVAKTDPLGALMSAQGPRPAASTAASQLSSREVTFPGLLSDNGSPTTALAAVVGRPTAQMQAQAPAPSDRLPVMPLPTRGNPAPMAADMAAAQIPPPPVTAPVVAAAPPAPPPSTPLPAQNVLEATPIVTRPRDNVTRQATAAAQLAQSGTPEAGPGHDGGYQLQVSSFHTQEEASGFAEQLRARNHKAYVVEAQVPGRGTWFRVRIGPFKDQHSAAAYRASFETREHVVPFIVPPNAK
jgi:cell division septation protein DedD